MDEVSLIKTRFQGGVWEGVLTGAGAEPPSLSVRLEGEEVAGWTAEHDDKADHWRVRVPVLADHIAEGVQTFMICEAETDTQLASFSLLAGEILSDDIRVEMDLLRQELDMLKKAFRRHCLETM